MNNKLSTKVTQLLRNNGLVAEKGNLASADSAHAWESESEDVTEYYISYYNGFGWMDTVTYTSQEALEAAMKQILPLSQWRDSDVVERENY